MTQEDGDLDSMFPGSNDDLDMEDMDDGRDMQKRSNYMAIHLILTVLPHLPVECTRTMNVAVLMVGDVLGVVVGVVIGEWKAKWESCGN